MDASPIRLTTRTRQSPARAVQNQIHDLEQSIDTALASGGTLLSRMVSVGSSAALPPALGQAAIERAIACLAAGSTMRAQVIAVHDELRAISGQIDLRELGWGDLVNSPSSSQLRQVG